jgi:hypothetical protein
VYSQPGSDLTWRFSFVVEAVARSTCAAHRTALERERERFDRLMAELLGRLFTR